MKENLTFRENPHVIRQLKAKANDMDITISEYLRLIIRESLL